MGGMAIFRAIVYVVPNIFSDLKNSQKLSANAKDTEN